MIAVQLYSLSAFTHGRLEHWQINNLAILGANSGSPAQAEGCLCPNSLLRDPENSGWGQQELGRGVPWGHPGGQHAPGAPDDFQPQAAP